MEPKRKDSLCSKCGTSFSSKANLNRHNKRFHSEIKEISPPTGIICGVCTCSCSSFVTLQTHIQNRHPEINLSIEKKTFYCKEDFEQWKTKIEQETRSLYSKQRGDQKSSDGGTHNVFHCHRSGIFVGKKNRKRRLKRIGSHKIGSTCPAHIAVRIKTFYEAMTLEIEYQSMHVGHECEVMRLPLTKEEKSQIAANLSLGVPRATLLSTLRKTFSPQKRIARTCRKDLSNICRQFQIDPKVSEYSTVDIQMKMLQNEIDSWQDMEVYETVDVSSSNDTNTNENNFIVELLHESNDQLIIDNCEDSLAINTNDHDYFCATTKESPEAFNIEQERVDALKTLQELQRLIQSPEMSIEKVISVRKELIEIKRQLTAVTDAKEMLLLQVQNTNLGCSQQYLLITSK